MSWLILPCKYHQCFDRRFALRGQHSESPLNVSYAEGNILNLLVNVSHTKVNVLNVLIIQRSIF